jgi:hypothetical protein
MLNLTLLEEIDWQFQYHPPTPEQVEKYILIRETAKTLATVIGECCPTCADRSAALRKLREAVMTANAAIALDRDTPIAE